LTSDKYEIDVEGRLLPWGADEISVTQLNELAGWPQGTQIIEVDDDNNQRTLQPSEVVQLKPGHGFAKRHRFQRG